MSLLASIEMKSSAFSGSNVSEIETFIKSGSIVALHTTSACRVFLDTSFAKLPEENLADLIEALNGKRVIYIDCNSHPGLLGNGEWEFFIKDDIKTAAELALDSLLRQAIIDQRQIPNKLYLNVRY